MKMQNDVADADLQNFLIELKKNERKKKRNNRRKTYPASDDDWPQPRKLFYYRILFLFYFIHDPMIHVYTYVLRTMHFADCGLFRNEK